MKKYISLTDKDRIELLKIARESIVQSLNNVNYSPYTDSKFLKYHCGAFVTLHKEGKLRGCIGKLKVDYPLYEVVKDVAVLAAFKDDRFPPVNIFEMNEIDIEISVLTPFKKIRDSYDIEIGKHGIYMLKEGRSGTFLPQVARENNWSLIELLGHCAQDKMGLGWNGWKGADIFIYEAEVFSEKEMN